MFYSQLKQLASSQPAAIAIDAPTGIFTYRRLLDTVELLSLMAPISPGQRVGLVADDTPHFISMLAFLDRCQAVCVLLPAGTSAQQRVDLAQQWQLSKLCTDDGIETIGVEILGVGSTESMSVESQVVLLTSGTSGPPKPAVHTWQSLSAAVRYDDSLQERSWLLTFDPAKFAGLQLISQALLTGGRIVVPLSLAPSDVASTLVDKQVEFASGTPTFWRSLLIGTSPAELAVNTLKQITLGGEASDQPLLDSLRAAFPAARITHIYASTEMGTCFSVSDGQAGFPAAWLGDEPLPCRMKIAEDGELLVASPRRMRGYLQADSSQKIEGDQQGNPSPPAPLPQGEREADDSIPSACSANQWFPTGDLVELRGERVLFVGRKSDTIHVAGNKVYPLEVEAVIRRVSGVAEVRVYGTASSVAGELVSAEIEPLPSLDEATSRQLLQEVMQVCRESLPRHKVPALVKLGKIERSPAGKISRS